MFNRPSTLYYSPYCKQCGCPKDWEIITVNGITSKVFFCKICK